MNIVVLPNDGLRVTEDDGNVFDISPIDAHAWLRAQGADVCDCPDDKPLDLAEDMRELQKMIANYREDMKSTDLGRNDRLNILKSRINDLIVCAEIAEADIKRKEKT